MYSLVSSVSWRIALICNVRMRDLGVTEEMIEPMTDSVFQTMAGVLNNSFKTFERQDVIDLYRQAL
jgi:alcohol dehydrogenase